MDKQTKQAIKNIIEPLQEFQKQANKLVRSQFNKEVRKEAERAVSEMMDLGILEADDKERAVQKLLMDKRASFDWLSRVSKYVNMNSGSNIGNPEKSASANTESKKSDQIWNEGFGFPN